MKENYSGVYFLGKFVTTKSKSEEEAANKYLEMVIGDRTTITKEDVADAVIAGIRMIKRGRSFADGAISAQPVVDSNTLVELVREFMNSRGYLSIGIDKKDRPRSMSAGKVYKEYREWCYENGNIAFSQVKFGDAITAIGFAKRRVSQGVVYEVYETKQESGLNFNGSLEDRVNLFLTKNNYANTAQKLFGENIEIQDYMASINDELVGVREDMEANLLYKEFCGFCASVGVDNCSVTDFSNEMLGLGFKKKRLGVGNVYEVWASADKYKKE